MIQGTGSDVGKSMIVAGLARVFTRRGLKVRPFKPQNMSNNAAVTADGGEIGRAQALQARAARVPLSVHMNPVLLKPQSEIGAQVVVQGKVVGTAKAREYQAMKPKLLGAVLESFGILAAEADLVLVEGAGSASEVNLRAADIANMGFARAADVPVVLLGDIDRGGVIASLVGTQAVIDPADAAMIVGFIVNRFRGDPTLFDDGMADDRAPHRLAGARPAAVLRARASAAGRGRPRPADDAARRGREDRRARLSAHRQLRRLRSAAAGTGRRSRLPPARRGDPRRRRAGHPAGLEGHHRRPRGLARGGLGHRPPGARAARRPGAGHLRRLPDARPQRRRSARHRGSAVEGRRPRPARRSTRCWRATRCWSRSRGTAQGVPFKGYEMHIGRTTGSTTAAAAARRRPRPGRSQRQRPDRRLLHPRPAGRRSPATPLARALGRDDARASTTKPTSTPRSTCWPTTSRSTSIATGCSRWRGRRCSPART